eukprot:CAMPEP_0197024284 /NCGR_PEP_ID=MMETSP1384-20130603/4866_1 /TAXON_ID=29189 /ORGANISM="Ammonia sp." /LENGTH=319 /DNA_ID=CAMNT_0042452645 /DNA_START=39 /DNA_END=998 /DNA_ORIENTATION=+
MSDDNSDAQVDSDTDDNTKSTAPPPDLDLSKVFEVASKLKSAQLNKIRKEYDNSPPFIKATQVYAERCNEWKDLSIEDKLSNCQTFKDKGNKCFNQKDYTNALNHYSHAISIFRYFEKKDERGEHLELKDYISDGYTIDASSIQFWGDANNYQQAKTLLISLLSNCAAVCLALREHANVVWCCESVLKYDECNVKALYRLCQSHQQLDTTYDLECALKYIGKAKKIDARNKAVVAKWHEIKQILRKQNQKDQSRFHGLFTRGSLYEDKSDQAAVGEQLLENERGFLSDIKNHYLRVEKWREYAIISVVCFVLLYFWGFI